MSSKSLVVFEKASDFKFKAFISLKKFLNFYKSLTLMIKSLHFSENLFKKPQNLSNCLTILEKA
jgi:hypothetical protein